MSHDDLREFALRYSAAWCSQDAAGVASFYSPGGSLTVNDGTPATGQNEIADLAQSFMTAFPDIQAVMDELLARDGGVEYRWTLTGANTGPGGTGKNVRISGFELWKIGPDGLIASSQGHFDAADYRRQLECGEQT